MPNFRDYNQSQTVFRQLTPDSLLEEDHPARVVDAVVKKLNLTKVYESYKDEGKPAYNPAMMLKVLFYSYLIGYMSSRKMEDGLSLRVMEEDRQENFYVPDKRLEVEDSGETAPPNLSS